MKMEPSSPELVQFFGTIVPQVPDVERRKMFGYPVCFVNGNMQMGLHAENIMMRLSVPDRLVFCEHYNATIFEPMPGRAMKEYVTVPKSVLVDTVLLAEWIEKSVAYARSLPPKTKKK